MSHRKRKSIYFIALLLVVMCTFSSTVIATASWLEKDDIKEVINYNIKLNSVTEEDVTVPDLPGYKVLDIRK